MRGYGFRYWLLNWERTAEDGFVAFLAIGIIGGFVWLALN